MGVNTVLAEAYGIVPAKPKKRSPNRALQVQLEVLLADPQHEHKLEIFETTHQLLKLIPHQEAPHPREVRYLLMNSGQRILPEAARNLTDPHIWYALAGLK